MCQKTLKIHLWLGSNIAPARNVLRYQQTIAIHMKKTVIFKNFLDKNTKSIKWPINETFVLLMQRNV